MYLKTIEIIGFKSFADKTTIDFDSGFTAIVGPNGSGKSNITEAIKWVLGEQSAKSLRGRKMDDVIFSGASNRNKAQYAQVTLTFDNKDRLLNMDTDEVSMSRRYTRAGESTYMINRQTCRLKDMTELMMDTGIGRDSFSIISQGQVEAIFMQKPEDRRSIFEEAAGVIKYKSRKKEAERKLEQTDDNLNRLSDILQEIQGRLEPLRQQRDAAIHYKTTRQELSAIEIALTAVQIETLNEQWEVAKRDLVTYLDEIKQYKSSQKENEGQLKQLREEESQQDKRVNALNEQYVALVREAEEIKGKIELSKQQDSFNQRDRKAQEETLVTYEQEIEQRQERVTVFGAEVHDAKLEQEERKAYRNASLETLQLINQSDEGAIEAKRHAYIDAIQKQSQLKNEKDQLEKSCKQEAHIAQRLSSERIQLEAEQKEVNENLQVKQAEQKEQTEKVAKYLTQYQEIQTKLDTLKQAQQKSAQIKQQVDQQVMQTRARKESLESLEREHTGFYFGVKNALNMQKKIAGIHGAIADLVQVPAEYIGAVETSLGGAMQHIVTQDRQVAKQVIEALKKQRGGRATFLPMDVIKGRNLNADSIRQVQQMPGYIGVLADLVQYDAQYQQVMQNLMGQTLVVDDLTHAQAVAQRLNHRYRVVTLARDIIHAGGSLSGGATKKQQDGIFSRKQEIDQLAERLVDLEAKQKQMTETWETQHEQVTQFNAQLEDIKRQGDDERFKERGLTQEVEQLDKQLKTLNKSLAAQVYEISQNKEAQDDFKERLETCEENLKQQEQRVKTLNQEIQTLNLSASEKQLKREEAQQAYQKAETDYAVHKEQLRHQEQQLQQEKAQLNQTKEAYAALKGQLEQTTSTIASDHSSIEKMEKHYAAVVKQQKAAEKEVKETRQYRQSVQEKANEVDQQLTDLNEKLENLYYKQAKLEGTVSRYEVSIDNHLTHLREEYSLTYERARAESKLTFSIDVAAQKVRELKRTLEQIGPVNLNAIEEYKEVYERYTFMTSQQEDVLEAKKNLLLTMKEMDQEVITRFKSTFEAVRDAFEIIFPKLFGGGKASLTLSDPTDLLHTGVDIVAQPPGKRLQHLSLLSGGEKALTAIALLFAILDVKKDVPFSILDEVEAALDEANVARYGRYLRQFARSTQFIVITHRKGTMEEANVLYGVTMQQSGVSKLASVRLEDYEEE